jgi:predicted small lipoprotein YifL
MTIDRRNLNRAATMLVAVLTLSGLAACGGGGGSPASPATVVDTAPPAPPTAAMTLNQGDLVKVAWQPNVTDADLAGYRLTRAAAGAVVVLVDEPLDIVRFVDDHPFDGRAVYRVTAVDLAGNESLAATVVHDRGEGRPDARVIH